MIRREKQLTPYVGSGWRRGKGRPKGSSHFGSRACNISTLGAKSRTFSRRVAASIRNQSELQFMQAFARRGPNTRPPTLRTEGLHHSTNSAFQKEITLGVHVAASPNDPPERVARTGAAAIVATTRNALAPELPTRRKPDCAARHPDQRSTRLAGGPRLQFRYCTTGSTLGSGEFKHFGWPKPPALGAAPASPLGLGAMSKMMLSGRVVSPDTPATPLN